MTPAQLRAEQQLRALVPLIAEALSAGQFSTMESLGSQQSELADLTGQLPLQVYARYWWAAALRLLGRHNEALRIFTWIVAQANDPETRPLLHDPQVQGCVTGSYGSIIECANGVAAIPVAQLHAVINDGMNWLESIGRPDWAGDLRSNRAFLLYRQHNLSGAQREYEAALALKKRNPSSAGRTLADYKMDLAQVLIHDDVAEFRAAIVLGDEVLADPASLAWDLYRACGIIAQASADLGEHERALAAAEEQVARARQMQAIKAMGGSYNTLEYVHRKAERGDEAASAVAAQIMWARRRERADALSLPFRAAVEARLLQTRLALRLPAQGEDVPDRLPAGADTRRATRYLASAYRFIERNMPLIRAWDQAAGVRTRQERAMKTLDHADRLGALLADPQAL